MNKIKYSIKRPGGGISLNAGHPEYVLEEKSTKVKTFDSSKQAKEFLLQFYTQEELDNSSIDIVEYDK